MMPSGGRRACTRSIQAPEKSVRTSRFALVAGFYLADRAPEGQIPGEQPSRAGDELPRETGEVAPIVAFLECDG
jgi:hypothetical protein